MPIGLLILLFGPVFCGDRQFICYTPVLVDQPVQINGVQTNRQRKPRTPYVYEGNGQIYNLKEKPGKVNKL